MSAGKVGEASLAGRLTVITSNQASGLISQAPAAGLLSSRLLGGTQPRWISGSV